MLDSLRSRLNKYFLALGSAFGATGLSPTAWTLVGLVVSFAAAGAYWSSGYLGELAGGVLLLLSGFFDIVDGAVARATNKVSRKGGFLDSTLDRVAEVAVFLGILLGGLASPPAVLLALSLSLLVSYTRAKGDSLGISLSGVGVGERSERILALAALSLIGLANYGVLLVLLLAGVTFLERVSKVARALARPAPALS